jgi:hypothetical protein
MHGHVIVTITNDFDRRTMATAGTGLGLRLVRGLASALAINFRQRQNSVIFATRLQLTAGAEEGTDNSLRRNKLAPASPLT